METHEDIVKEVLADIDSPEPVRAAWELGGVLEQAIQRFEQSGQVEDALSLAVDWGVCRMFVRDTVIVESNAVTDKEPRLSGYLGYKDGSSYPNPARLTDEHKEYLARRSDETHNPILKAHYKDVLWETTGQDASWKTRRLNLAHNAVDAYLESAKLFAGAGEMGHAMVDALDHAAHLAMTIHKSPGGNDLLIKVIGNVDQILQEEADRDISGSNPRHPRGRWVVDLARLLASVRQKSGSGSVSDGSIQRAEVRCTEFATLHSASDPWDEQEFHGALRRLAEARDDWPAIYQTSLGRLQATEHAAKERRTGPAGDPLAAAGILQHAIEGYEKLALDQRTDARQCTELKERIAALRREVRDLYREGKDRYGIISVPLEIDQDEIEGFVQDLLAPDDIHDCLDRIASEGSLLPNLKLAEEQAQLTMQNPGLLQHIPRVLLSDNIPVADAPSLRVNRSTKGAKQDSPSQAGKTGHIADESRTAGEDDLNRRFLDFERDRNLMLWIGINSHVVLHKIFERLREQKGLTTSTLIEHFDRSGLIDEDNREILTCGFERYFAADGIGAMHILAPQFEDVFRSILDKAGASIITERRGQPGWQFEVNLNTLLTALEASATPGSLHLEKIRHYIRLVFVSPLGWNLRNRVAHGLIEPVQCAIPMVETVLHLFLLLIYIYSDSTTFEHLNKKKECE